MKVEVAVLGSPCVIVRTVSVDIVHHCETELGSCVKVEVDVLLASLSLILTWSP